MKDFDDEMIRAIKYRLAPALRDVLRDTDFIELINPTTSIKLPVQATVMLTYSKNLAAFRLRGRFLSKDKDNKEFECGEQFFSTRDIVHARDKFDLIDYLFDEIKNRFKREIIEGELTYLGLKK